MVSDGESLGFGDRLLAFFNLRVVELFHFAAVQTYQVIVVLPLIEFIDRFAAFKMAAGQDVGLFELCQHPVHRGQADIRTLQQQHAKHILGGHVALRSLLEDFQYFQPGQGGFEAGVFEFVDIGHGEVFHLPAGSPPPQAQPLQWADHIATPQVMPHLQRSRVCLSLLLVASATLVACGSLNGAGNSIASVVTPYKMEIVQGNFVSKEQAAAVKPGMSRTQVRDILGTPLLASIFHADRWDYVFTFKRQGVEPQARRVTVFFKGDALERMEADALPSETEFVSLLDSGRKQGKVPVLELSEEELKQLPAPVKAAESKPLPPLPVSYPPLESSSR